MPDDRTALIAIQPLGDVPAPLIKTVEAGLSHYYQVRLEVLPACPLPAAARMGLDHCSNLACLMRNDQGKLPKRDDKPPEVCEVWRNQLGSFAR